MFGKKNYKKLVDSDEPSMKGNRALEVHPDAIKDSFTGDPQAKLVHVSGSGPNVFGHTLLCFNTQEEFYAHIHRAGKHKPDVICGHEAFEKYLEDEGKTVLHEIEINDITDRNAAVDHLERRLKTKYFWGAATHNCAEWAVTIIQSGKSQYKTTTWLPSKMTKAEFKDSDDSGGAYQRLH